jgi:hypothetical protein
MLTSSFQHSCAGEIMANLKANGGAVAILRRPHPHPVLAGRFQRLAVCRNGVVLIDRGNGAWKRHGKVQPNIDLKVAVEDLLAAGWTLDRSPGAQAAITRSTADSQWHRRWTRHTVQT